VSPAPLRAVVDASVAVKIFVPETHTAQAQGIFVRFASENGAELIVPDLFFVECANVFWKWVQRSGYPAAEVRAHLHDLTGFGLMVIPTQAIAEEALEIALKHRITAYDACYVVASNQTRLPLITADEKLVANLAKSAYDVQWLGDIEVATK
jgi:predicted nucleic acid-binding protein